ncbi:MAG: 3-hydroxyacyl-ACP dehydratase FabZ [Chthoniobacterales bacterium]
MKSSPCDALNPITLGLPHRKPFLFVDSVTELIPGASAVGLKTFAASESFFEGHFPGNPIVPGVILTEALAQLAGIAGTATEHGQGFLLSAIRSMKFPRAVHPEQVITLHAKKTSDLGALVGFDVSATVNGEIVASGQVILSRTQ